MTPERIPSKSPGYVEPITEQAFTFPAFDLYRELKEQTITARAERSGSVLPADDSKRIADAFTNSAGKYSPPDSIVEEAFDPGNRAVLKADDARLALRLQAVDRISAIDRAPIHGSVERGNLAAPTLKYLVCGYEVMLTRALKEENRVPGAENYSHRVDLILRAENVGIPAVCEVKSRGDADVFLALVQAMAYAAFACSPVVDRRLRAQLRGFEASTTPPRLDVALCVQHLRSSPERTRLLEHAAAVAPLLLRAPDVARSVRRIVCLDFSDSAVEEASSTGELVCEKLFAFEEPD
ncbi:MAG: hypothetical protein JHC98_05965 [Thermoleophilaceae bacterium]|nr:hypothetical protein [Thermoleophilaceae bacterium]